MELIFSCRDITKSYGDDTLFENLTIDFKQNEQLGLIGMNGSGKSTFLKLVAGISSPDTGEVVFPKKPRVEYLPQDPAFAPDKTIEQILYESVDSVFADDRERHAVVQRTLGKGGFSRPDIRTKELSGGWLKRLAILKALCCQPDLLLLDEPTNHLDITGIVWLENVLQNAPFSFIVVSHDRAFLEATCKNVMEIARYYAPGHFKIKGGYREFKKQRERFLAAQQKQQSSLASKMRREEEWLRQGAKARTTKAKFRIEQAEKLRQELQAVRQRNRETASVGIDFSATGRQTKKLLRAKHIEKSINGALLFSKLSFELGPGDCLGIAGENGSGKSTLLSILEKKTAPDAGRVQWAENLKIAVFDQKRSSLDQEITLKEALNPKGGDTVIYKDRPLHIVSWAKRFLFMPDQLQMPVKSLSGGEQARIILANIMLTPCDLLLLDEPTNDLDILSLDVLEDSIRQFPGAVVIVSHDRYIMERVCRRILYLDPGQDAAFLKDFNQIMKLRRQRDQENRPRKKKEETSARPKSRVKFSFKDKYELEHIEDHILESESLVDELSRKIQEPDVIRDGEKMKQFCTELEQAQEKTRQLYERWEVLEAKKQASEVQ